MATLAFNVEADYDKVIRLRNEINRLNEALNDVSQNRTPEEIQKLESQLESARAEMSKTVTAAAELGSKLEDSFSNKEITQSIKEQLDYLDQLKVKYAEVEASLSSNATSTTNNRALKELDEMKGEIEDAETALHGLQQKYQDMSTVTMPSFKTQVRETTAHLYEMRMAGEENTEEYKRLEEQLAKLVTVQKQVQIARNADTSGATQISGMLQGVKGLTGAYTAAASAASLFAGTQEQVAKIQSKLQTIMSVLISLQNVSNMLHSTSIFRLRTLTGLQNWWNKILKIGRGEQQAETVAEEANTIAKAANATSTSAAAVAQTAENTAAVAGTTANITLAGAFRMVGAAIKSIPVFGWIVAGLAAIIGVVTHFSDKISEAKKKTEEFYKAVAEEVSTPIASIENLSEKWNRLGDVIDAKLKFIYDNKQAFDSLGIAINNVNDAENALITNKDKFIEAQLAKAKASVVLSEAQETIKTLVELDAKIAEEGEWISTYNTWTGLWEDKVNPNVTKRTKKEKELADQLERSANYTKEYEDTMKEAGITSEKTYAENSNNQIRDEINRLQTVLDNLNRDSDEYLETQKKIDELREKLNGDTTSSSNPSTTTQVDNTEKVRQQQEKERLRQITDMEFETRQAQIDAMDESNKKVLEQYKLDFEKQQESIERWYDDLKETKIKNAKELWEADPNNKGQQFDESTVDLSYTEEEINLYNAKNVANEKKYQEQRQEVREQEAEQMRKFLKEYGSYEQKRQAITEEYAEKQKKASTVGEQLTLQAQQDKELRELEMEYQDSTNWQAIFTNIDKYSLEYLQEIQDKLQNMLKNNDLGADEAKALGDQLNKVNNIIITKSESWAEVLGLVSARHKEIQILEQNMADAQARVNEAQDRYNAKLAETEQIKDDIAHQLQDAGLEIDTKVELENADTILQEATEKGGSEELIANLTKSFSNLGTTTSALSELTKAINDNKSTLEANTKALEGQQEKNREPREIAANAAAMGKSYLKYLQAAGDLADMFGLEDASETINMLAQAGDSAMNALNAFASGDLAGAVVSGVTALGTLISGLFSRESDPTLHKDINYMTQANEDLSAAIDNLSKVISDNTSSLTDASDAYRTAVADLEQSQANTQEMLSRSGASYGGHHSANYYIDKAMTTADWERISNVVGKTISSAGDFWTLTSEEMYNVSTQAADLWTKIKKASEQGNDEVTDFMEDYITYWEQLDEMTDTFNEKLTATTFDSVFDNFKSAVSDMEHTAADFADDFEEMMKEAVISSVMSTSYASRLQQWYEDFKDAMESDSTLTPSEQQALKDSYMDMVSDARAEIEALYDTMGWSKTGYSQSASVGGFNSMSEDTAEELNGRFTALQEAGYQILEQSQLSNERLSIMTSRIDLSNVQLSDIGDISRETQSILANSYLELQMINENTANAVTQLLLMAKYMKNVKENTDKL